MMPPINEHDEFLLSRLLDNDLPPAEAEALRRRIEAEPALQRAFAHMTRLDGLLKERRADRPEVDWKKFYARVTNQVERAAESKASPLVIRLKRWLAIGLPVAAAAAIGLVVTLRPANQKPVPGPMRVTHSVPVVPPPGVLAVAVQRPSATSAKAEGPLQVNFKHSQQLAEATWQADAMAQEKPPSVVASAVPEFAPQSDFDIVVDGPPL
jgi:anti-sigma factor RsiW